MTEIKFGTDGWRAIIAKDFTLENVLRISEATAIWMNERKLKKVVIGYDTRFGGKMFSEAAAKVFASSGIQVLCHKSFVTTPMISFASKVLDAGLGVMITASHNAPSYNGYKLKSSDGGPLLSDSLEEIEALLPEKPGQKLQVYEELINSGLIKVIDLESLYLDHLAAHFNLKSLIAFQKHIVYDSMFGAGKKLMKRIFPEAKHLHDDDNPGFHGISPEPLEKNLEELCRTVKENDRFTIGFANDGDADRIGIVDAEGNYIDAHHILLLLLYYLAEYKKEDGKVVVSVAGSEKIQKLAEQYQLPFQFTKIGFKHITPIMLKEKVLLGGEEAGGMTSIGHIPERDGIWVILIILELMLQSGKEISELIDLLYEKVGKFSYYRNDLKLAENKKQEIISKCSSGAFESIAGRKILDTISIDGFKYYFSDDTWLMIRPSGTEPVLRLYAQSSSREKVLQLLEDSKKFLLS